MNQNIYDKIFEKAKKNLVLIENENDKNFISNNLVKLYKYTDGNIDLDSILQNLSTFEGFFKTSSEMSSDYLKVDGQYSFKIDKTTGKISHNRIIYSEKVENDELLPHLLTHENVHLLSTFQVERLSGHYFHNGIHVCLPFMDEVMTEFTACRLVELDKIENFYNHKFIIRDSKGSFTLISETGSYNNISGFGYIFDSLLHNEIIASKYNDDDNLYQYRNLLFDVENKLTECMKYQSRNNYGALNNSIENLCVGVITDKYHKNNLDKQELLEFYMPLRWSLKNYGNVSFQKDIVKRLDNLVINDLILDDKIKENKIPKILDKMCLDGNISLDYFNENLNSVNHKEEIISRELSQIDSFEELFSKDKEEISKSISDSCNITNDIEDIYSLGSKISLGLHKEKNIPEIHMSLGLFNYKDINNRNLAYVIARQKNTDSVFLSRLLDSFEDEELKKSFMERDSFGKNAFEYGILEKNIPFSASILFSCAERNIEKDGILREFVKEEESFIKEHPKEFFEAVYYSSLYGDSERVKIFNETLDCLKDINFKEIKTNNGCNFLGYIINEDFKIDISGYDKFLIEKNIEKDALEDIKVLLCNDFSFLDKNGYYSNNFGEFIEKVHSRNSDFYMDLYKDIKEMLESEGTYEEAINGVNQFVIALNAKEFGFDFDTIVKGRTMYEYVTERCGLELFEKLLEISDKKYDNSFNIVKDSFKADNSEIWEYGFKRFLAENNFNEDYKNKIIIEEAKKSLNKGKSSIFKKILKDYSDIILDKHSYLLEQYAQTAIKSNNEISTCCISYKKVLNDAKDKVHFNDNSYFSKFMKVVNEGNEKINEENYSFSELVEQKHNSLEL